MPPGGAGPCRADRTGGRPHPLAQLLLRAYTSEGRALREFPAGHTDLSIFHTPRPEGG